MTHATPDSVSADIASTRASNEAADLVEELHGVSETDFHEAPTAGDLAWLSWLADAIAAVAGQPHESLALITRLLSVGRAAFAAEWNRYEAAATTAASISDSQIDELERHAIAAARAAIAAHAKSPSETNDRARIAVRVRAALISDLATVARSNHETHDSDGYEHRVSMTGQGGGSPITRTAARAELAKQLRLFAEAS